jgi:hypothetical protein
MLAALLFFLQVEAFAETLNTTGGIKDALLTSEERMALGADINLQQRFDAQRLKAVATGANNCGLYIVWMNSLFHCQVLPKDKIYRR